MELLHGTVSGERGSIWIASCEWGGQRFKAVSRSSPVSSLCRQLVASGCPALPALLLGQDGKPQMRFRSIHEEADSTMEEGRVQPIRRARFKARDQRLSGSSESNSS